MVSDADEVDLLRRRVLNVVGHELRTPVTTLAGLADQLVACEDVAARAPLAEAVARNAHRLERLVDDLLLASGLTTVVPVGEPETLDLVEVARSSGDHAAGVRFHGSAIACCRRDVATRALGALLENAGRYGDPPVEVTGSEDGTRAVIEISSGGLALPPADLALACELFFRGERAVTSWPGLGVGLALARTLARADGGDVVLQAGNGGGVIARLELPRA